MALHAHTGRTGAGSRSPARVRLRPTMTSDLPFVLSLEQDPENLPFITPWQRTQHDAAVRFPDFRHFIIEAGADLQAAGFLILIGCRGQNGSVELKRMVVRDKGQGHGRAALRVAKKVVFDDLVGHRFWLHAKAHGERARALYESEGFVLEGTLRDAVRVDAGFESLLVMSMLDIEYAERRRLALELPA